MANTKDIQRRIKSIVNTKKITKAMEMVAASKMRKAVEAVLKTRTYANLSWETVLNLARSANNEGEKLLHPLLIKKEVINRVAVILITSNRGLCGGFNTAIINKALASVRKHEERFNGHHRKITTDFILFGKKGGAIYHHYGFNITADFPKLDLIDEISEVAPVTRMIIKDYLDGKYDKIMVTYTDFINAAKQAPRVKQILPVELEEEDEFLGVVGSDERVGVTKEYMREKKEKHLTKDELDYEYIFEPTPKEVLDEMVPRLIEVQLYQALLESNASEHSARMSAMRQATDAASDMLSELTLSYNKARQAGITAEIAEVSAGANAIG